MKFFDNTPIYPIQESLQNDSRDDIKDYDESELKDEYKRALSEKEDLLVELEDAKKANLSTYAIKERIQNADKYIEKLKDRMEELGIKKSEEVKIKKSSKTRYKFKKYGKE